MRNEQLRAFFYRINQSHLFQFFVISAIVVASLSVGVHTYSLSTWILNIVLIVDYSLSIFFFFEIMIRLFSYERKRDFFIDGWNVFDLIIIVGSLIPITGSTVLLARLLRIFRVLRLVSVIPELQVLINSLLKAIPRMSYIALLMFIIFYIYATVGTMLFTQADPNQWGDLGVTMLTLFRVATFESWGSIMWEVMAHYSYSWIYFVSFIFITAFTFLNMMIGTILDVMSKEAQAIENEHMTEDEQATTVKDIKQLSLEIKELKQLIAELKK